jgi:hypothetical protein
MRATKPLTYRTRRLLPGDVFEVERNKDARVLRAIRKAEDHVEIEDSPMQAPVPPPVVEAAVPPPEDLAAIRAEYEAAVGRKPFNGWNTETLREKIAAHKADDQS